MKNVVTYGLAASFALGMLGQLGLAAQAADYVRQAPRYVAPAYDDGSRICAESGYLGRVSNKFRYEISHVPYLPDVQIVDVSGVHENRYLPADPDHPIARRYCEGTATMSDGRRYQLFYLIEYGMGFAGVGGTNVEFCVNGFDRWEVYGGRCRVLW